MTEPAITLQVHSAVHGLPYLVTFEGPQAEDHAIAFYAERTHTHRQWVGEYVIFDEFWIPCQFGGDGGRQGYEPAEDQPHLIDPERFPRLYAELNPLCHHGMYARDCMDPIGPHHFGTREWEMAHYGE